VFVARKERSGLRERLSKGRISQGPDLSVFSQGELDGIVDEMNNRPRTTHT